MTCKVYPCEDPLFMGLVGALENYCMAKDCALCAKSKICQQWFNTVSFQSSLGSLNQERAERHLQKLNAIILGENR